MRLRAAEEDLFNEAEGCIIAALLETQQGVLSVKTSWRTGSVLIYFEEPFRDRVLLTVTAMTREFYEDIAATLPIVPRMGGGLADVLFATARRIVFRSFFPLPVRQFFAFCRAIPFFHRGLESVLIDRTMNVSVLDASAIAVSMLRGDFKTASAVMYLLRLGDDLEAWTHKQSRESLSESLQLHVDSVWLKEADGSEREIPTALLQLGNLIVLRQGGVIPADGVVADGEATVNQASMTGESEPVHRVAGQSVFAGTILEEGEIVLRVTALSGNTRVAEIARLIDESENLKAVVQSRAERVADALVPYSFALAGLLYFFTGNVQRASAALMADYSCAIKLATPLTILTAMRSGVRQGVLIKGGKFLEGLASVDTVVFDKTGTLTVSTLRVSKVLPMEGYSRDEILKIAACLEEHFPHSLARAVVRQAQIEGLKHREEHDQLQYVVAHGIRSSLHGKQALIGSAHFIFEDEGIQCSPALRKRIEKEAEGATAIYLVLGDSLAGVICIEDPLRAEARDVVTELKEDGVEQVIMLTGDNKHTARHVAGLLGVDRYRAELLPADKIRFVKRLTRGGSKVAMVGDGINDTPALAAADVGVSLNSASDIAQEVADVVLYKQGLQKLPYARRLSRAAMDRIQRNYRSIIGVNSLILLLGSAGLLSPALSALMHNLFTLGVSLYSMSPVECDKERRTRHD